MGWHVFGTCSVWLLLASALPPTNTAHLRGMYRDCSGYHVTRKDSQLMMVFAASDGKLSQLPFCENMGKYFDRFNLRANTLGIVPKRFYFDRPDHLLKYQCALEGLAGIDLELGRKDCSSTGSLVRLYYKGNTEMTVYTLYNSTFEPIASFGREFDKMKEVYEYGCYTKWSTSEILCYVKADY